MMNIQYVIYDDVVYVLEVNPRSSRTVPIMSKVTKVPMIEWATHVQLGANLKDLSEQTGLLPEPNYYSVKAPIFSASKLKGVDHVLGPEMKSTGETLGLGATLEEALSKAMQLSLIKPASQRKPTIFCSIADRAKEESLCSIAAFTAAGYHAVATDGTAEFLLKHGIPVEKLTKDKQELLEFFKNKKPDLVLNIPTEGRNVAKTGFYLRELAVRYQVPFFTSFDTLKPWIEALHGSEAEETPRTLAEYGEMNKLCINEVEKCQLSNI